MKRAILYIFTIATILWYSDLSAQNNAVRLERESTHKEGNMLIMDVSLNVDSLAISKNEIVTLIPVLESTDRQNSHSFDSIVITGKRKEKMIARNERFNNNMFEETPKAIIRHEPPQTIPMRLELPY